MRLCSFWNLEGHALKPPQPNSCARSKLSLKSWRRCSKPPYMVWPLKKRTTPLATPAGFSLGEGQAAPQNTDTIQKPVVAQKASVPGAYVIPKGYKISGAIACARPVVVDGELAGGNLTANEVLVRPGGSVKAPSSVGTIVVEGAVGAQITAREAVEVKPGGVVRGPIEAPTLRVAQGGVISSAQVNVTR